MKTFLILTLLATTANAAGYDSWYVCTNLDTASTRPERILLKASLQRARGFFDSSTAELDASYINAYPFSYQLNFGPVAYGTSSDSEVIFEALSVKFYASGTMEKATFISASDTTVYGNCILKN